MEVVCLNKYHPNPTYSARVSELVEDIYHPDDDPDAGKTERRDLLEAALRELHVRCGGKARWICTEYADHYKKERLKE